MIETNIMVYFIKISLISSCKKFPRVGLISTPSPSPKGVLDPTGGRYLELPVCMYRWEN